MRQVVLDTETTGLEVNAGHRVIEIGAVEIINRRLTGRHFHQYLNPERDIDAGALEVHGIDRAFLADKPLFAQVRDEFLAFVDGAELVIHNATFDVSFLDYELQQVNGSPKGLASVCQITDSLAMARQKHPGQKNNLDALCRRYEVDNSQRQLHGALLDAEILADVYLLMTGGQTQLFAGEQGGGSHAEQSASVAKLDVAGLNLPRVSASPDELEAHESYLDFLAEKSGKEAIWRQLQDVVDANPAG